jgi:hypothetical protein
MERAMKKLMLAAAISALTLSGALACEHDRQAANTDRTTVACSGGNCQAASPTGASAPANDTAQDSCTGANCERAEPTLISLRPTELAKPNDK